MATFNLRCPKNYPRRCNLLENEKEHLERAENYKAFLIYQFAGQDDYLVDTIKSFFHSPTYHVFDASQEAGLGIKICKICRLAQASDFGIMVLTPENPNAYLETGMMMGMGKRNLYVASKTFLNSVGKTLNEYVGFDLTDQLVIPYENRNELLRGLEREVPPFIDNVIIGTALERERRSYWRSIFSKLSSRQKTILKSLVMVSEYTGDEGAFQLFVENIVKDRPGFTDSWHGLLRNGILHVDWLQSPPRMAWKIDPIAEPYIHELLFEKK